jgi:hypothetical protein
MTDALKYLGTKHHEKGVFLPSSAFDASILVKMQLLRSQFHATI